MSGDNPASKQPASLRIACVATAAGHAGGAAIAMERLAAGLRASGAVVDVVERADCGSPGAATRRLDRGVRRAVRDGRTPVSNTLFTADWPAWDLAAHPAVAAADLVNVHWVAGFVAAAGIRRLVEAGHSVVWTLHDMRPFTGGCHYSAGCRGFTARCVACPQLVPALHELPARSLARARRRLAGIPLRFVSPSRWLADELVRSSIFDARWHEVRVIPNGLDLTRFCPGERANARRRLGLPAEGLGILLGSVSLAERRKGSDVAVAAVARATAAVAARSPGQPRPFVISYGSGRLEIPGVACHALGSVAEAGVLEATHACDLHLTMTREDNLPNTVMEALACGRPVLATRTGGIPEMVCDGVEGWLVDVDDATAAATVIERLAAEPGLVVAAGRRARDRAEREWDAELQARRYLDLAAERWMPNSALATAREHYRDRHLAQPLDRPPASGPLSPAVAAIVHRGSPLRGPLRVLRRLAARTARGRATLWPRLEEARP